MCGNDCVDNQREHFQCYLQTCLIHSYHARSSSAMQSFGGAHGPFGASTVSSSSSGLRWYCSLLVRSHVLFFEDFRLVYCSYMYGRVTGLVNAGDACMVGLEQSYLSITKSSSSDSEWLDLTTGSLFSGDEWGISAAILSMITNMFTTILIACRAWCVLS